MSGEAVLARLKNLSKERVASNPTTPVVGDMLNLLHEYMSECQFRRFSAAGMCDDFILKGGRMWTAHGYGSLRPTVDTDFSDQVGSKDTSDLVYAKIINALSADLGDHFRFDVDNASAEPLKEGATLGGIQIKTKGFLKGTKTQVNVTIEVGYRHRIPGGPRVVEYPLLLPTYVNLPFKVSTYPFEMAAAEKIRAAIEYADYNTRLKDYYDLMRMNERMDIDLDLLAECLQATCEQHNVAIPDNSQDLLGFGDDFGKTRQNLWEKRWNEWTGRSYQSSEDPSCISVMQTLRTWMEETNILDRAKQFEMSAPRMCK